MRSVIFEHHGDPGDVLTVRDVPEPQPKRGEVLVRMLASPINPSDLMTVRGVYGVRPALPASAGFEGVGIVESTGGGLMGRYLAGKRVVVLNRGGGNWSEKVVIPSQQALPVSKEIPLEQAAMFFVNPAAAYVMTREVLKVPRGEWLMQSAAGSALGQMVIRLGKKFGFRTLNIVRREQQVAELKSLGGDAVLCFDGDKHDANQLRDSVRAIVGDGGVRYAIDPVGGKTATAMIHCLGTNGRLLLYGTLTEDPMSFSPRAIMSPEASVEGFWLAKWMPRRGLLERLRLVRQVAKLIREGVLVSEVGAQFPLEQIREAVRESERTARGGKVLLRIAER